MLVPPPPQGRLRLLEGGQPAEVTMQWVMQLREGPECRLEGDEGVGPGVERPRYRQKNQRGPGGCPQVATPLRPQTLGSSFTNSKLSSLRPSLPTVGRRGSI